MKKLTFFLYVMAMVFSIVGMTKANALECTGSYGLTSQTEVDAFNCTTVTGDLRIGDIDTSFTNITNLNGLSELTSVGGSLDIWNNNALTNIDGLASLTSVGVNLIIGYNDALTNIDGLASLTSVGLVLDIYNNDALTNIDGLASLTSVGGHMDIYNNYALTNIDGLASLTSVGGHLYFIYNNVLTNIDGLASLTSVGGGLGILANDALMRCCGIYPLLISGTIGGETYISDNIAGCNSEAEIISAGPCDIEVAIDIKPGSDPNCFNINDKGVIPVAILGSENFDINTIDTSTLFFAGLSVRVRGNKGPLCHVEDVSGDFTNPEGAPDGYYDLVCQFEDDSEMWVAGDSEAELFGNLLIEYGGTQIHGSDSICVRP